MMRKAIFFLTIILALSYIGIYYNWYDQSFWFDVILHFLGGFFVAMLFAGYLKESLTVSHSKIKKILILVGATTFIGVMWEFYEYVATNTIALPIYNHFHFYIQFIGDLTDTIKDLFNDVVGGLVFALIWLKNK